MKIITDLRSQIVFSIKCVNFYPTLLLYHLEVKKDKRMMKVPKGTSDYQATWIVDDDDEENGEVDEESSDDDDDDGIMDMDGDDEENASQVSQTD